MITVIHKKCGKTAFFFREKLKQGDTIQASNIVNLDGSLPNIGEAIICGSCGEWIHNPGASTLIQEHWTDWFIIDD